MPRAILAAALTLLAVPASAQDAKSADPLPAPLELTTQQDHKLMMRALGIESLRPGANGMDRNTPNAANYDERGSFLAAVAAGPVYRLLGRKDLDTSEFPEVVTGITNGELAFRQHAGGHTTGPNWPTFLRFADRYIEVMDVAAASGEGTQESAGSP